MQSVKVLAYTRWYPLREFGLTNPIWSVHIETLISTAITLVTLFVIIMLARRALKKSELARFAVVSFVKYFLDMVNQTLGVYNFTHFTFVTSLFIFIFLCNIINVAIPWIEEPTSDLNTTLALGIVSFLYIQGATLQVHGLRGYIKELCTPFFMFPLHITGKLATIVSISFRLFGNIFGSSIITQIYNNVKMGSVVIELGLLLTGMNILIVLFFGIFEGLIQAFVFYMLTLTYLAIGIQDETEDHFV